MLKTLDRYQKCSYGAVEVSKPAKELEVATFLSFIYNML
jgi:MADS-box transcription factor